jgi:phenylpropionate dioxygenase-like ring-hydroxylating dioxygenase large terminal subunit
MIVPAEHVTLSENARAILADAATGLRVGRVPLSIYGDAEIFRAEIDCIFNRNWMFLAHDSEIPEPGDYVLRYIAGTPWIVARSDQGDIHVMFDSCRHRGARLCRSDKGNAARFRCPFHAWTYKNDGQLIGVPMRNEAYRNLDDSAWGLIHAPRVELYHGMIWANLDADASSFREHLGDFAWYVDVQFGAEGGMEVYGDPQRWLTSMNWKTSPESFSGDSYHTQFLHRSIVEIGLRDTLASSGNDVHVADCGRHAASFRRVGPETNYFWGYPEELHDAYRRGGLSAAQVDLARSSINTVGTIFPNLSMLHFASRTHSASEPAGALQLRQTHPVGPDKTEIWTWILVPRAASPEYKSLAFRSAIASFGTSGNFEQDDMAVWGEIAAAARTPFARSARVMLNYEMGMPGMGEGRRRTDWEGPGTAYDSRLLDATAVTYLTHWVEEMLRP